MVVLSLVLTLFSLVAYVHSAAVRTYVYFVRALVFFVEVTLVVAFRFNASRVCSAEKADFFMMKWK